MEYHFLANHTDHRSPSRKDPKIIKKFGGKAGWFRGGTSSLRRHIASAHYPEYHKVCEEKELTEQKEAIPKWKKIELAKKAAQASNPKTQTQSTLDGIVRTANVPTVFSKDGITDAVVKFIVCDDQVSPRCYTLCSTHSPDAHPPRYQAINVANKPAFTNCLVAMRPKTTREELPSAWTCRKVITNSFVDYLEQLCIDIAAAPGEVSTDWDLWTREQTGDPYFGMLGQWFDVSDLGWTFRAGVLAFNVISGQHSGENLGRYYVKFLDRVGITSKSHCKVSYTSNVYRLIYSHILL